MSRELYEMHINTEDAPVPFTGKPRSKPTTCQTAYGDEKEILLEGEVLLYRPPILEDDEYDLVTCHNEDWVLVKSMDFVF